MAKDKDKKRKGSLHDTSVMDTIIDKMLMSLDDNYVSTLNLSEKNAEFKSIINDELDMAKGLSHNSILDFTRAISSTPSGASNLNSQYSTSDDEIYKYIAQNSGALYNTYTERFKNKFIEAKDLSFISKMVPSLAQAVQIALNHITSSDDLSGAFTRSLDFGTNLQEEQSKIITQAIEQFETDNKLLHNLKNTCYRNCLITGKYYVYAVSYSKLFTEYSKNKAKLSQFGSSASKTSYASEGVIYDHIDTDIGCIASSCALESAEITEIQNLIKDSGSLGKDSKLNDSRMSKSFIDGLCEISTIDSAIPIEVMESMVGIEVTLDNPNSTVAGDFLKEKFDKVKKPKDPNKIADATVDLQSSSKGEKFDITGTFIKFIDADKIIPIKVLDKVIGYLYVETKAKKVNTDAARFVNGEFTNVKKDDAIDRVAKMFSDKIISKFSSKFVSENASFKDVIANCIMANGIVNNEYKIQYLSPDDLFEFNINPDKEGEGQSMLKNALFPAKLLTSLIVKKILNYINKSGDKTVAHIRGGQTDISKKNNTMRIIRNLQESNITFGDMMADYSMMFHKYANDGNMVMPMGRSGNRLIEFEKMEGQNIDMNSEYEKNLENQALTATGVPPLLIEQYNQADFSKAYTTAHLGFAGTVAGLQSNLEEGTTNLYKRIIENLDIDDSLKSLVLPTFMFKLPRPKSISVLNNTEAMSNAMSVADNVIQLKYGDNPDENKKELINGIKMAITQDLTPFIDWDRYLDIITEKEAEIDNIRTATISSNDDIAGPSQF